MTGQNRVLKGVPTGGQFAADTRAEPEISLTAPKTTSRGRTTCVTLPDGTVATRTSKTKTYSHAVVVGPELPELVIAHREASIRRSEAVIAAREEALKDAKFKKRARFPQDPNPDLNVFGEKTRRGFEYFLMSADGKERLEEMWGDSTGETDGSYDPETFQYDGHTPGRIIPQLKLKTMERIDRERDQIRRDRADIDAVKAGTYNLGKHAVASWASRRDLAERATSMYAGGTRRASVVAVDQ